MRTLFRAFPLWLILGGVSWILATATGSDMARPLAVGGLVVLLPVAAWLTILAVATLPEGRLWRLAIWPLTLAGWLALLLTAQGRFESHANERWSFILAFAAACVVAAVMGLRTPTVRSRRHFRDVATVISVVAIAVGTFVWRYDARTSLLTSKAEARWTEIGLPMAEFETTLTITNENSGSLVLREVLRNQMGFSFYRGDTRAALQEPVVARSAEATKLAKAARDLNTTDLPPSDDVTLPSRLTAAIEPMAPALEADYEKILSAEPPAWSSDPKDGYSISVPNIIGVRTFSELIAADAMRRFSVGDQDGAARALQAGLHLREGLRQNPTFFSLMLSVAIDALLASKQVRLPAVAGGIEEIARDGAKLRFELLQRLQFEGWANLRFADRVAEFELTYGSRLNPLPTWTRRIISRIVVRRECAIAALSNAEHAAIQKSPDTLKLPDFGMSLHEAVSAADLSGMSANVDRVSMYIHSTLLLREQCELIRDARARLAAGLPVESRDSVVLPGVRWELIADADKGTIATRMVGEPVWLRDNWGSKRDFWMLPLDGSAGWEFRLPTRAASAD